MPATSAPSPTGGGPARGNTRNAAALSPEQRYRMVQEAAYFMAEKNGFAGKSEDYWAAAEIQISAELSGKKK